jgi:hypothetical protein
VIVKEFGRKLLAKEDDFGFYEAVTRGVETMRHLFIFDSFVHAIRGIRLLAVDATLPVEGQF